MTKKRSHIYLDYSATTPVDPVVTSVISEHLTTTIGNASSIHAFGRTAKVVLEESREVVANSIGAEPSELFFTSGGTEADNHAVIGAALAQQRDHGKNHIVVSSIEHHAVLHCVEYLLRSGFTASYIPVDKDGLIHTKEIEKLITRQTCLISVMHSNNEVGTIQPVGEISELAKRFGITFHSDTVQSIGKIPVNVNNLGMDLLSISAHKIYGPKGIGAIYIRKGTNLDALLHGGSQERKNRAGTENIPLIAGFAKAIELADVHRGKVFTHVSSLKSTLKKIIAQSLSGIIINGDGADALPHILNISLDSTIYDVESESLLLNMDLQGVAVSSGSACTSGSIQPSHVLNAMGRDVKTTQATIRFSFGKFTTMEEVEQAGKIFVSIVQSLPRKKGSN
ncbi:MAG: cysteine desulfurase family protein [Bacteroidota bacterium]|nr:cysteine desulfurase family protein [Bacteroidota bacterium]